MPRKQKKKRAVKSSRSSSSVSYQMEFARQLMHLCVGLGCVTVLLLTGLDVFRNFLLGLLLIGIVLSVIAKTKKIAVLNRMLSMVERTHEGMPGQGAFFFLIGVGIPAFAFSNPLVVLTGIVALTYQDAFSTLFGKRFGKTILLPNKTLEGAIGGFVPCALALLTFLPFSQAVGIAFLSTLVELLPIEDAFSIPLVASFASYFRLFV